MPELPDIEVFSRNLNRQLAGHKLEKIKILQSKKLADKPAAFTRALAGKKLLSVYRSGKEMRFAFAGNTLLGLHLMLTGDIFIFKGKNTNKSTIAELYFSKGIGMALTDRMKNANIRLDPIDKEGIDAIAAEMNFKYLSEAFKRKRNIKSLLADQDIIRGLGNSYTDEILWEARISPYSIAEAIPADKVKQLLKAMKKILKKEIMNIEKEQAGKVNGEVKKFLKIHSPKLTTTPTGAPIIVDKKGMMKTYYSDEQVLYQ